MPILKLSTPKFPDIEPMSSAINGSAKSMVMIGRNREKPK